MLLAIVCTLFGGGKMRSGGGRGATALPGVTAEEIAQWWRLESVVTNDAVSYVMPEGVLPSFNWHKRGTFGEWARLDLGDFAFPLGTNGETVTSFSVFNDGRIRPTPRDAVREICAVGVPMLAMQGASRFWVGETAAMDDPCPQLASCGWSAGSIVWTIPTAWREPRDFSYSKGWLGFTTAMQTFAIDAAGTVRVEKFNCGVERDVQGHTSTSVNLPEGR